MCRMPRSSVTVSLRVAADEIDHPVMRAAEAVARQHGIGLRGEVAIGVEQQLDALAELLLAQEQQGVGGGFYVSHIDLFWLELLRSIGWVET